MLRIHIHTVDVKVTGISIGLLGMAVLVGIAVLIMGILKWKDKWLYAI